MPTVFTLVDRAQIQSQTDVSLSPDTATSSSVPLGKLLNHSDLQLPLATRG